MCTSSSALLLLVLLQAGPVRALIQLHPRSNPAAAAAAATFRANLLFNYFYLYHFGGPGDPCVWHTLALNTLTLAHTWRRK